MKYSVVLADPPWFYHGSPDKNATAGKHYNLMKVDEIGALPVRNLCAKKAALFLWATCPRLPDAIEVMRQWGFHYRGVAYVWIKDAEGRAGHRGSGRASDLHQASV